MQCVINKLGIYTLAAFSKHCLQVLEQWTKNTKAGFAVRALEAPDTVSCQFQGLLQLSIKHLTSLEELPYSSIHSVLQLLKCRSWQEGWWEGRHKHWASPRRAGRSTGEGQAHPWSGWAVPSGAAGQDAPLWNVHTTRMESRTEQILVVVAFCGNPGKGKLISFAFRWGQGNLWLTAGIHLGYILATEWLCCENWSVCQHFPFICILLPLKKQEASTVK